MQESNDNAKMNKLKPTLDGLNENKATAQDADIIFGLFSPFRYGIKDYEGYRIDKFRDHVRFLEIIGGREGGGGSICPLYFDGAVNYFEELPLPDDSLKLQNFYMLLEKIRRQQNQYLNVLLFKNFKKPKLNKYKKIWVKLLEFLGCQEKVNLPQL